MRLNFFTYQLPFNSSKSEKTNMQTQLYKGGKADMEEKNKKTFDLMKELEQIKEEQKKDRILIEHLLQELQRIKENRKKDKFLIQYLLSSTTNQAIEVSNFERSLSMRISNLERHNK